LFSEIENGEDLVEVRPLEIQSRCSRIKRLYYIWRIG